ncbi:MAG: MobC family plasmid mobilization relaxosome protein [Clostridia bacterium]|nr:MobC family plasmid mobilization relaxosome protein [Clostridia bacterium]
MVDSIEKNYCDTCRYFYHRTVITPREEIDQIIELNKNFTEFNRQLNGMATNVNQMAHIANGTGELPTIRKLIAVGTKVDKFRGEAQAVWLSIRQLINRLNHMEL